MILRPYQAEATAALWKWLEENGGNPLVVASVGAGKSVMMAKFIQDCVEGWPETRIALVTHSAELVEQNYAKLMALWPEAPAGIYSAGLGKRQIKSRVLVGSIQSLWRRAYDLQDPSAPDLLIVDECHTISRKSETMWGKFIADLKVLNPRLRVVGYSGTHWRLDSGYLHEGEGKLFDGVAFEIGMLELVKQGYLCPLVPRPADNQIDTSGVRVRGGEYVPAELESAADAITGAAVDEIVRKAAGRQAWLVFCSGRLHAMHVRDAIRSRGITCETVLADTPRGERGDILKRFRDGRLQAVTNVSTMTTGVDVPRIDLIACLRPTKSAALYVQMLGRGMRLSPGKEDCLVLDHSGLIAEHGPVDKARPKPKRKGLGVAPMKECPSCFVVVPASAGECPECGHLFPPPERESKIDTVAANLPVMSNQAAQPEWVEVDSVAYRQHNKPGKPPSVCVTYQCGLTQYRAWACPEHDGYARTKFVQWWGRHAPGIEAPNTVREALENAPYLKKPSAIQVRMEGKFPSVVGEAF